MEIMVEFVVVPKVILAIKRPSPTAEQARVVSEEL